jgi:hypothetical protein
LVNSKDLAVRWKHDDFSQLLREQGPPGPEKEILTRIVRGPEAPIQAEEGQTIVVECAPDEVATGGGYGDTSFLQEDNVINPLFQENAGQSGDLPLTSWELRYTNPGPEPVVIEPFAVCAKLVDAP